MELDIGAPRLKTAELKLLVEDKVEFLKSFALFKELSTSELEGLSHVLEVLELEPGVTLLTQNQPADAVYFLKSGAVKILVNGEMVAQIDKVQCFGEMSCLTPDTPASASVVTAKRSQLLKIAKEDFLSSVNQITSLWKTLFLQMSGRMVSVNGRLSEILNHLPQGLVKVSPLGIVSNDYSVQCTRFFHRDDIAGLSFAALAFPLDEKKQASWLENLGLLFSENNMSFETCASLLAAEFSIGHGPEARHFTMTYAPCKNGAGKISAVDIGIEDITKQKELERKHGEIKAKQDMLSKITQSPDSFVSFLALAEEVYTDTVDFAALLRSGGPLLVGARVEQLMRRLHSLKGISGVFSLQNLKATVHSVETLVALVKNEFGPHVTAALEEKLSIFRAEKARARGVFDEIPLDLRKRLTGVVFSPSEFQSLKELTENSDLLSLGRLLASVEKVESKKLVSQWSQEASKIADAIGKSVEFSVAGEGGRIGKVMFTQLDQVLVHLLRNGLDHGLELPDERLKNGKAAHGRITVTIDVSETELLMVIEDDGRGINGPALAKRARANAKLDQALIESYVARSEEWRILLLPGFSTVSVVTDLSGRGVGLDAVASAIESLGGSLTIASSLGEGACFFITVPLEKIS